MIERDLGRVSYYNFARERERRRRKNQPLEQVLIIKVV